MGEKKPFISVVMPVYNAEAYLNGAITSLLSQTFTDFELVIVDDLSTDQSGKMCEQWAERDSRVRVYHLTENLGAGRARNYGMEKASGRYITFLDADDRIEYDLYKKVISLTEQYDYDVLIWGVTEEYYDETGRKTGQNCISAEEAGYTSEAALRKAVIDLEMKTLFGYQWNHLYKRSIIMEHNIRFCHFHLYEDYFFNLSYIEFASSMAVSSCTGYYYQKRMNQSLTKQFVPDYFKLSRKRVGSMAAAYRRWGMFDTRVRNCIGERYLRYIFSALMRNNEKEAYMNHTQKKDWVKRLFEDELYRDVARECCPESSYLKLLQKLINCKNVSGCLLMGRLLWIIRKRTPQIYNKKGQIHS